MRKDNKNYSKTERERILVIGITLISLLVIMGVGFAFFSGGFCGCDGGKMFAFDGYSIKLILSLKIKGSEK